MNGFSEELLHRLHRERHQALDREAERMAALRRAAPDAEPRERFTWSLSRLIRKGKRRAVAAVDAIKEPGSPLERLHEVVAAKDSAGASPQPAVPRWRQLRLGFRRG